MTTYHRNAEYRPIEISFHRISCVELLTKSVIAATKYVQRHNAAATIVYMELTKMYGIDHRNKLTHYSFTPQPAAENENSLRYWDIIKDKEIAHNRLDNNVINKTNKTAH